MTHDWKDKPKPRQPRQPRQSGSSGNPSGGMGGLAVALIAGPVTVLVGVVTFLLDGYNVI